MEDLFFLYELGKFLTFATRAEREFTRRLMRDGYSRQAAATIAERTVNQKWSFIPEGREIMRYWIVGITLGVTICCALTWLIMLAMR